MRRFLCAVCLVALLAGCAPASSTAQSSLSSPSAGASERNTEDLGELTRSSSGNAAGFFTTDGQNLVRLDPRDMTEHVACSLPGCDHTGEECEAHSTSASLLVLKDAVYTLEYSPDGGMSLVARAMDGTHPRVLNKVGRWLFRGADEKYLYGFCDGAFGRVSREDGTETYLTHGALYDFVTNGRVAGIREDAFVCVSCDPNGREPTRIFLLDRGGGITQAAQIDAPRLSSPDGVFRDGEFFYIDQTDGRLMAVRLPGAEVRLVTQELCPLGQMPDGSFSCSSWALSLVGGEILVRVEYAQADRREHNVWLVHADGSVAQMPQRQELRDFDPVRDAGYLQMRDGEPDPVEVLADLGDVLVVQNAMQFSDAGWMANYALTDTADYLAGRENYREFSLPEGEV